MPTVKEEVKIRLGKYKASFKRQLAEDLKTIRILIENQTEIPRKYIEATENVIKEGIIIADSEGNEVLKRFLLALSRLLKSDLLSKLEEISEAEEFINKNL